MSRYRIPVGILRAEMAGEQVLLNPETGKYYLVNATGRALLSRMEAGSSLADAVAALGEESGKPAEAVESDAAAFTTEMVRRGLLEQVGAAPR